MNKLFTIPFSEPFARSLAAGILARFGEKPESLSKVLILLPTRRACRTLRNVFLELSGGKPLLLPRIQPLGDIQEEEVFFVGEGDAALLQSPASGLRRQMLLATLIQKYSGKIALTKTHFDESVWLAGELLRVLDEMQRENVPWESLDTVIPAESGYAEHWKLTLDFLIILRQYWPEIERENQIQSTVQARNERIAALTKAWRDNPPETPVIAAGSTGSIPSTAELLGVIAGLPQGAVVLQGVDMSLDEESWNALEPTHPQYGFEQLLARIHAHRKDIQPWGASEKDRDTLLSRWMVPAEKTTDWHNIKDISTKQFESIHVIEAEGAQEESVLIAALLREALETGGKTAALVTPDRDLARRTASIMRRFGVMLDDSAGRPLVQTPAGAFLQLLLDTWSSKCDPVAMLSFFKHPLFRMGRSEKACRDWARSLELRMMRGQFHSDWRSVEEHVAKSGDVQLQDFLALFMRHLQPCIAVQHSGEKLDFQKLWKDCVQTAESLSLSEDGETLWDAEGGETLWQLSVELEESLVDIEPQCIDSFAPLVKQLLQITPHRPRYGGHPRLHILSPIEARLQHFDRIILGGLNEDSWPEISSADPWLSRPMRAEIHLPALERRIGQSAHDFCQQFASGEVFLTRARKRQGVQTVASRWLIRLQTMLAAAKLDPGAYDIQHHYKHWVKQLDLTTPVVIEAPAPKPAFSARPRSLSVTQVQDLLANPYKVYASKILKLRALDDIMLEPDARMMGNVIHAIMDEFILAHPTALPEDIAGTLEVIAQKHFEPILKHSASAIFWRSRFRDIASWLEGHESAHRQKGDTAYSEQKGAWKFELPAGPFTLTAKADRLDVHSDRSVTITDYKTGSVPKKKEIESGEGSQLVLEALILAFGVFGQHAALTTRSLQYWLLKGQGKSGVKDLTEEHDIPQLMDDAKTGLAELITKFDDTQQAYTSRPYEIERRKDEIDHLARIKEWSN